MPPLGTKRCSPPISPSPCTRGASSTDRHTDLLGFSSVSAFSRYFVGAYA
jgi:hypothetical protein